MNYVNIITSVKVKVKIIIPLTAHEPVITLAAFKDIIAGVGIKSFTLTDKIYFIINSRILCGNTNKISIISTAKIKIYINTIKILLIIKADFAEVTSICFKINLTQTSGINIFHTFNICPGTIYFYTINHYS